MTVNVQKDLDARTMTVSTEFAATPDRVWKLWSDPRQLERWWGPPTYPATVTTHDLSAGGKVEYYMTGPEGDQPRGYLEIIEVDAPRSFAYRDGFANEDGSPNNELPMNQGRVMITDLGDGRTSMAIETKFPSTEAMEQVLAMGMEEGMSQAMAQIDALLVADEAAEPVTKTLKVPGATITYDLRRNEATTKPTLFLIGSPMAAAGFVSLSERFTDRTIATYDPRGSERSTKDDPTSPSTPDEHASDLKAVIEALGTGPVDLFASSGGAINALAFVSKHPDLVVTLVAHEPPAARYLEDAKAAMAAAQSVHDTYMEKGSNWGMAKFMALVMNKGPLSDDFPSQVIDPSMFGMPTEDDGSRDDVLLGQNMVTGSHYEFDPGLKSASTRIVLAAGEASAGELSHRGAHGVADWLGKQVVTFPSDHGGFFGGEYGQTGDPDAFAAKLREVLG